LDWLAPILREKTTWIPLYVAMLVFWVVQLGRKAGMVILGLLITVAITDFCSSALIKKQVRRLRPCNQPELSAQLVLRVDCGSGFSFTSSHAANHFGMATYAPFFLGRRRRLARMVLLIWATAIALSQIYVGVHFPADVIGGAGLGLLTGYLLSRAVLHLLNNQVKRS
jgi:undecaprenyl-diphosphatase